MISFDLQCGMGHIFEGWFRSSADFDAQVAAREIPCAVCGHTTITKAVMAPNVGRKGNRSSVAQPTGAYGKATNGQPSETDQSTITAAGAHNVPPEMLRAMAAIAQAQAESLPKSRYVGVDFARQARAMHAGEQHAALIHGQTSPAEAEALLDEGVSIMPLLVPFVPPEHHN
jgi:hypothetical protein